MFQLIGIVAAAALLFASRKKAAAAPPKKTAAAPAKPTPAAVKQPVKQAVATPKTTKLSTVKSPIQGLPLPTASQVATDMFGSMLGTNPQVLNPTLPYGYYGSGTNSIGQQTPPVVTKPIYR